MKDDFLEQISEEDIKDIRKRIFAFLKNVHGLGLEEIASDLIDHKKKEGKNIKVSANLLAKFNGEHNITSNLRSGYPQEEVVSDLVDIYTIKFKDGILVSSKGEEKLEKSQTYDYRLYIFDTINSELRQATLTENNKEATLIYSNKKTAQGTINFIHGKKVYNFKTNKHRKGYFFPVSLTLHQDKNINQVFITGLMVEIHAGSQDLRANNVFCIGINQNHSFNSKELELLKFVGQRTSLNIPKLVEDSEEGLTKRVEQVLPLGKYRAYNLSPQIKETGTNKYVKEKVIVHSLLEFLPEGFLTGTFYGKLHKAPYEDEINERFYGHVHTHEANHVIMEFSFREPQHDFPGRAIFDLRFQEKGIQGIVLNRSLNFFPYCAPLILIPEEKSNEFKKKTIDHFFQQNDFCNEIK